MRNVPKTVVSKVSEWNAIWLARSKILNYKRIENADKVRKKKIFFVMYRNLQARNHSKMCWTYFKTIGNSVQNVSPS